MRALRIWVCGVALFWSTAVAARSQIEITDAWVRAPSGQVNVAAGYLTIFNGGDRDDVLLGVETEAAARTEVHTVSEGANGMMRMRPVPAVPLPSGTSVTLAPGGTHLMLTGLDEAVEDGTDLMLRLTFQHAGTIEVVVPVARRAPGS